MATPKFVAKASKMAKQYMDQKKKEQSPAKKAALKESATLKTSKKKAAQSGA